MAYKRLTKQQWDSLPAYKKNQMRARTPDLYNYYQDRYVTKAKPVAQKRTIEAEDGMLGGIATTPSQEETPAPVSRTISGPPTDEQRALAYRLFAQNNDRRMLNEIIEYDKEAAYIKETSAANESVSKSPYEDGSASASFYGNQSFANIGATADSDNWWDVADPKAFFGVQGERTDEQKERVQQFRQEWGNVRGAAAVNGLIDGTYTADQLSQNWGAENLASVIRAETFEVGEFNEGDNFGSYLQSEFDNVSSFINPSGEGVRGTLGTIDTALNQGSGGPKGAERGVTVTAGDLASSSYMTAIRSAAETAGIDIYVDGPAGGQYELNVGQYDDVPLGSYHTVREADSPLEMIFEAVLKAVVVNVLTAGLGADLASLGEALSSSGATATAASAASGANVAYETTEWARNVGDILTGIGQTLEAGGAISSGAGSAASGGLPPYIMNFISGTDDSISAVKLLTTIDDTIDYYNEAKNVSETPPPEAVIQEEVVSLDADDDLLNGDGFNDDPVDAGVFLNPSQENDFNLGKDVILD
jgi:hypothetical protein